MIPRVCLTLVLVFREIRERIETAIRKIVSMSNVSREISDSRQKFPVSLDGSAALCFVLRSFDDIFVDDGEPRVHVYHVYYMRICVSCT